MNGLDTRWSIYDAQSKWIQFFLFSLQIYAEVNRVREKIASYIGADSEDVVFIPNASTAINAVLRSLIIKGKVLYLNIEYQMTKNTLAFLNQHFGDKLIQQTVSYPLTEQQILDLVSNAFVQNPDIELLVASHISSIPSLILPVKKLAQICHANNASILIDGKKKTSSPYMTNNVFSFIESY